MAGKRLVLFRHRVVTAAVRPILAAGLRLLYGFGRAPLMPNEPCLVLCNHVTEIDPVCVALAFRQPLYYVASDHIFRKGLISRLLVWAVGPIPIVKSQLDLATIRTILQIKKEDGSVCLFPEGNRTLSGETGYINESIGKLIKTLRLPVHIMRLHGGYFTNPRWGLGLRKGRMYIEHAKTLTVNEVGAMAARDIFAIIKRELFVSAYEAQKASPIRYRGKSLARALETVLFVCPACHKIGCMVSRGNEFFCSACGMLTRIDEYVRLSGGAFGTITEWYEFDRKYMADAVASGAFVVEDLTDPDQKLYLCSRNRPNKLLLTGTLFMNSERLLVANGSRKYEFKLSEITKMVFHGRKTLQFSHGGDYFEIKSKLERSALKYMSLYYFSVRKGEDDGFIGI